VLSTVDFKQMNIGIKSCIPPVDIYHNLSVICIILFSSNVS